MKPLSATYRRWAIDLRLDGRPGFRGDPDLSIPILLWRTRRHARSALAQFRASGGDWAREHYWNHARVVPVLVTIRVQAPR